MTFSKHDIIWITNLAKPVRDKGYTRTFYSYPAKFLSKLPHGLIKQFSKKRDLIFDPFVGGGTTGLEAMLLKRHFIGYDLNPFAILVSSVKTTYLNPKTLQICLNSILNYFFEIKHPKSNILDKDDKLCLGMKISHEVNALFDSISSCVQKLLVKRFFELALIHSIKIVGRRDFESKKNWKTASIIPIFKHKAKKMIQEISLLPISSEFIPVFKLASNHNTDLDNDSVDLIVTSPPYKDKDVEYQQIQIQRRTLHRSKRSNVISTILGTEPLPKNILCGGFGVNYWENSLKSLKECYRVLKPDKLAFYWTGFKNSLDLKYFENQLTEVGFEYLTAIQVHLSNDRAASSRSTHHGRATGMMSHDYLFVTKK